MLVVVIFRGVLEIFSVERIRIMLEKDTDGGQGLIAQGTECMIGHQELECH